MFENPKETIKLAKVYLSRIIPAIRKETYPQGSYEHYLNDQLEALELGTISIVVLND